MNVPSVPHARPIRAAVSVVAATLALFLFSAPEALARADRAPIEEHCERRARLMEQIGAAVAVLAGERERPDMERYTQSNDFFYVTGVETPGAFALLDGAAKRSILFLPPREPLRERWSGPQEGPGEETARQYGFDECLAYKALPVRAEPGKEPRAGDGAPPVELGLLGAEIHRRVAAGVKKVYVEHMPAEVGTAIYDVLGPAAAAQKNDPWDRRLTREQTFTRVVGEMLGKGVEIGDVSRLVRGMRQVKSPAEIAILREAARVSAEALRRVMAATEPGVHEYQLAALLKGAYEWAGAQGYAYSPIVGTGVNATVIHYMENAAEVKPGDLILIDSAARYHYYCSDITRTYPASGRFTPAQRRVYDVVLRAQQAGIAVARPGATMLYVHDAAARVIGEAGYAEYFPHFTCHTVGMAVHDDGFHDIASVKRPLKAGMLITVEPGIYIPAQAIGVRIEDTLLITDAGAEVLTSAAPKEPDEIERLMAARRAK
ncbi:MAG: aminopeptidase P N-terminal domain-containing protein [Planctomycetes bacterium]|nr:aminopeptidase P N-terminal domain-containing protein [Planctomycetota bacterium]